LREAEVEAYVASYFCPSNDFEDQNEDWIFISQSFAKIELIHISGGNGGTDYLKFEGIEPSRK